MTGFDYIVLLIVGIAAAGGFMRGFLQEILSLAAWVLAAFAIRFLHTPLTLSLQDFLGDDITTSLLAFTLLLLIPYAAMKVIANNVGMASRNSLLGPIDRVLGFGFGALKGMLIVVIAFSLLVLGYDTVWSYKGRPNWITTARSYELVDSSSRALVQVLAERRATLRDQSDESE
ncbi:CvpA family protein [Qipengyuania citrea]|jgi:membrane protein required for colicin V production|uniref:CvpA family protein n=2 Tax=Qipengyuania TaxID=1855416 RepID=A0ABY4U8Y1_9SPHN|nr:MULTISPECIES: CvpA family protein [Erythrobacteraceae]MAB45681.1 colicin V production protein [Sphingomonadaceae bacterium]MBL4896415.1 CvpA family protein [Erythrobacter sp.]MEC7888831.1 CvpA family protein [Pseudomonadota bacterium]MAQ66079.1 colicin V production protein [Sphingomonadaceae bacterium]MBX7489216.1 CvpA family protein [Qipengyuania aerophila]|tara:strand:+ start:360 stop:881 length:522 start_codon:yes stop_codon:yes gene_type:complete